MKKFRKNIFIILPSLWILSTVSMIVAIPLHFFVKEHKTLCEKKGESGCSDSKNTHCEICAFDLYSVYLENFRIDIHRFDRVIGQEIIFINQEIISKERNFASLRAPPYCFIK